MGHTPGAGALAGHPDRITDVRAEIAALLDDFALEITADEALATPRISSLAAKGTQVFLPFLPNRTFADIVPAAEHLAREGMIPVPHIAARRIADKTELTDTLQRLRETADVTSVLVIAGDTDEDSGPYPDSLALLESGVLERCGITKIGVAGYPEPHPLIPETVVWDALLRKCQLARSSSAEYRIISQFTFSHQSVLAWIDQLRQKGVTLPVIVSVPGPATLKTLLAYAKRCGVSTSLRQLTRNRKAVFGLATKSAPDQVIAGLARHRRSTQEGPIVRILFNVFGGVEETAHWIGAARDGRIIMNRTGSGFTVEGQ